MSLSVITHGGGGIGKDELQTLFDYSAYSSFIALAGNVNEEMTTAALGKNNEARIKGVGKALSLYAWYKGETHEFPKLQTCETLDDVIPNSALFELYDSAALFNIAKTNEYMESKVLAGNDAYPVNVLSVLNAVTGLDLGSVKAYAQDENAMKAFLHAGYRNNIRYGSNMTKWSLNNASSEWTSDIEILLKNTNLANAGHNKQRCEKNFGKNLSSVVAIFKDETEQNQFYCDHHPLRFANTTGYGQYYNSDTTTNGFSILAISHETEAWGNKLYMLVGAHDGSWPVDEGERETLCIGAWGEEIMVVCSDGIVSTYSESVGYKTFECDTAGVQQIFVGLASARKAAQVTYKCLLVD